MAAHPPLALVLSAALLLPQAAAAQKVAIDPALGAALAVCLHPDQLLADRLAALQAVGWVPVAPGGEGAVGAALAPGFVVTRLARLLVNPAHDPQAEAERLDSAAQNLAAEVWRIPRGDQAWLVLPEGRGTLHLRRPGPADDGGCQIAADLSARAVGAALRQPVSHRPQRNPALAVAEIGDAPAAADRISHLAFAPGAFAGRTALPQIYTPTVRMPD